MNINTGTFVAPKAGIYQFTFSALTGDNNGYVEVHVIKNGQKIFHIEDGNEKENNNNLSYVWMLILQRRDSIQLKVGQHSLHSCGDDPIYFTGHLLQ